MSSDIAKSANEIAYLEHYADPTSGLKHVIVDVLPFRIGRAKENNLTITEDSVSREHVEVTRENDRMFVRDLGSRNGTFVNGKRIEHSPIMHGDILHVGKKEFRFGCETSLPTEAMLSDRTRQSTLSLPKSMIRSALFLEDMLRRRSVSTHFQPIVDMTRDNEVIGYEALGRGAYPELNANPMQLFQIAGKIGHSIHLSRVFRWMAVQQAAEFLDAPMLIFLNTHPTEMQDPELTDVIKDLAANLKPGHELVLEVHEGSVAELKTIRELKEQLKKIGVRFAYDDFGAGQARLIELVEAPPDYVKLDMSLIRDIHLAEHRQELVAALCRVAKEQHIQVLAEGIETAYEAETCKRLGCTLAQGYYFGKPLPAEECR